MGCSDKKNWWGKKDKIGSLRGDSKNECNKTDVQRAPFVSFVAKNINLEQEGWINKPMLMV